MAGEQTPRPGIRALERLHQRARKVIVQQPQKSNVEESKDVPPPTATPPQPENPTDHSPITESSRDPETVSNASEKVADEVLVTHREPIVGARNPTNTPLLKMSWLGGPLA
jgi:hypothetical protein